MSLATWLLILLGPWLAIAVVAAPAAASWPDLLGMLFRPACAPRRRTVARPRPARMAVA